MGASLALYQSNSNAAGFSTNFKLTGDPTWGNGVGSCTFGSFQCLNSPWGNGDPTPFQLTLETIAGTTYFHTIVGDPATGFAIESYTKYGAGPETCNPTCPTTPPTSLNPGDFSPDGGGNELLTIGNPASISASFLQDSTNMSNVFGDPHVSGTGTQDPSNMVFRMVMTSVDGSMSMEVVKPFLDKKPMISETVQDAGTIGSTTFTMSSLFVADMRTLSYSDSHTPIPIISNLLMKDTSADPNASTHIPNDSAYFDIGFSQQANVTAGRYTYTPGTKWDTQYGWDSPNSSFDTGHYTYEGENGFDPLTFDWASKFDYSQNALSCTLVASDGISRNTVAGGASCPNN